MTSADYRVVVVQSTGKKEAILDIARLEYGDTINNMRPFSLIIGKANENDYSKFNSYEVVDTVETGVIYIYRKGVLDFAGIIENPIYDKMDRLVLSGIGMEAKITWKSTGVLKTYSATALSDLVISMIGDITDIDVGATNEDSGGGNLAKVDISGKNYLAGLKHAIMDIGDNEWYMTYSDSGNSAFNNTTYRGSNTSIATLVEGIDISKLQRTKNTQMIYNRVTPIGKSEGETQIKLAGDGYRSATDVTGHGSYSMTKYGIREPPTPLINRRIQTVADLTKFADNFLTQHMYPVELISFDVDDIDFSHNVGDLVTLRANARLKDTGDVNTADMRIISQKRIITAESERLILGVTKEGLNTTPDDITTRMNRIEDQMLAEQTTNQVGDEYLNKNKDQTMTGSLILDGDNPLLLDVINGVIEGKSLGRSGTNFEYVFSDEVQCSKFQVRCSSLLDFAVVGTAAFHSGLDILGNSLDMNTQKIINVVDPTSDQEAATKKYVDDNAGGSGDISGPGSATNNAIVRWHTTSGTDIQNSGIIVDDDGNMYPSSTGADLGRSGTANTWNDIYLYSYGSNSRITCAVGLDVYIGGTRCFYVDTNGITSGAGTFNNLLKIPVGTDLF